MFPELKRPRWHIVKFLNKVKHLTPAWTLLKLPWWFSQFYCLSFCWLISSVHIAAHTDEKEVRNHISQCCFWKLCDTTCQLLNNPTLILTLAVLLQFTPPVPAVVTQYANAGEFPTAEAPHVIKTEIQTAGHLLFLLAHLECERMKSCLHVWFDCFVFVSVCGIQSVTPQCLWRIQVTKVIVFFCFAELIISYYLCIKHRHVLGKKKKTATYGSCHVKW